VKNPSPAFIQIISTDYLAQNFFVMIFGGWVIYSVDAVFEGKATFFLAIFAAILTPIGLLTFFWRYRLIKSTFENGMEISGRITEVKTISNDFTIHYEYNFKDQKYQYRNRVKKNDNTQNLRQGQQVTLLMHEKTPHIAFIKTLYFKSL
jgi:hypothetical protein